MKRHSTDLVGLIFGTAFLIAGVGFLVNETTDNTMDPAWATGLGLMLLGAVALIATLVRGISGDRGDPPPMPVTPAVPGAPAAPEPTSFSSED